MCVSLLSPFCVFTSVPCILCYFSSICSSLILLHSYFLSSLVSASVGLSVFPLFVFSLVRFWADLFRMVSVSRALSLACVSPGTCLQQAIIPHLMDAQPASEEAHTDTHRHTHTHTLSGAYARMQAHSHSHTHTRPLFCHDLLGQLDDQSTILSACCGSKDHLKPKQT